MTLSRVFSFITTLYFVFKSKSYDFKILFLVCALDSLDIFINSSESLEIFFSSKSTILAIYIFPSLSLINVNEFIGSAYKNSIELISNFVLSFIEFNKIFLILLFVQSLSNEA